MRDQRKTLRARPCDMPRAAVIDSARVIRPKMMAPAR